MIGSLARIEEDNELDVEEIVFDVLVVGLQKGCFIVSKVFSR